MKMVAENIVTSHESTSACVRGGVHDLRWKVEPMRTANTSRDTARPFSRFGARAPPVQVCVTPRERSKIIIIIIIISALCVRAAFQTYNFYSPYTLMMKKK